MRIAEVNVNDTKLPESTIDAVAVDRLDPPKDTPQSLSFDNEYNNATGFEIVSKKESV
jgi:hypothetical protein